MVVEMMKIGRLYISHKANPHSFPTPSTMARHAVLSSPEDSDHEEDTHNDHSRTRRTPKRVNNSAELSPSPATSFSSDKENRVINLARNAKDKARAMPPSKVLTTNSAEAEATRASKRRRLGQQKDRAHASLRLVPRERQNLAVIQGYSKGQAWSTS